MFSSHDCIFHVEQVPTDWQFLFSACGVNMLPPWPLPLRHSHSCLYTRSVFERKKMNCDTVVIHACTRGMSFFFFLILRPFVRGTPMTHSEGLLLRVGALPCAPTYNRAAWYSTWSSIVWGLHSHTNAARRPQFTMQTALQHRLIICTEDVTAARRTLQRLHTDIFSGHDCVFLVELP